MKKSQTGALGAELVDAEVIAEQTRQARRGAKPVGDDEGTGQLGVGVRRISSLGA